MKIKGVIIAFISAVLFVCCEQGNGDIVSNERKAANFNRVISHGSGNVNIHFSEDYKVIVTTDSNIQDNIEVKAIDNTLHIERDSGNYNPTKLIIDIYMPELKAFTLSGSGKIKINSGSTSNLTINLSGSGNIDCQNYDTQNVNITISGSGNVKAKASTTLKANLSGSGSISAQNSEVQNAEVTLSGSASIKLWVRDSLTGKISGSGSVLYKGSPSINIKITGSGRVKPL